LGSETVIRLLVIWGDSHSALLFVILSWGKFGALLNAVLSNLVGSLIFHGLGLGSVRNTTTTTKPYPTKWGWLNLKHKQLKMLCIERFTSPNVAS